MKKNQSKKPVETTRDFKHRLARAARARAGKPVSVVGASPAPECLLRPRSTAQPKPTHTDNGYDPRWIEAINGVLEDRETGQEITDITEQLWDDFIGPMIDAIEDGEIDLPKRCR